jgi:two-component system, sensor histidine kinase and response regulator
MSLWKNRQMDVRVDRELLENAEQLFREQQHRIYARTDRMFAVLLVLEWIGGTIGVLLSSPLTWQGAQSGMHPHLYAAFVLGGLLAAYPVFLALRYPGRALTRYTIAVTQMLFSSLFIHMSGGRIETHFHVFGSLAFLAFYRDWRVLVPATIVVAADHFIRGAFWPESVFGAAVVSQWRWVEHAAWVVFEDIFLFIACHQGVKDLRNQAWRQTELERRNAEYQERTVQLEQAYQSKNAIVETALDAVVSMNEEGVITEWNPQAERTFGWTAPEALGRSLAETIIPSGYRQAHRDALKRLLTTGERSVEGRVEIIALHRDGHEFPIELAVAPIYDGRSISFCGFVRDITERRQAALALCQAKEAAEEANRAKSTFLAHMSHEVRTPLNGILGFAEVLQKMGAEATDEERADYLETINRSGRHLLGIINDVLDLSKIESGQIDSDPVRCAPHAIVADAVSFLRVRAREKGIDLRSRWEGRVPQTIVTDPSRFRQLLMNLIGNAIKFTEKGWVEVVARVENTDAQPRLAVDVNDTGIGIAPEHLASIFQPFVQADGSITRRFGGTGLGLTISRQIAERLGGTLEVSSEAGRGSQFSAKIATGSLDGVELLEAPIADVVPDRQASAAPISLSGVRILLVEDGATNRKLISLVLRRAGAEVALAEDGEIGVSRARAQKFDVILMDMQMPVMDGYQATAALRGDGLQIPIIALTANSMKGDAEQCLAAGCSGFLSKPIDSDRLLNGVATALRDAAPSRREAVAFAKAECSSDPLMSSLPMDDPDFVEIVREFVERLRPQVEEMRRLNFEGDLNAVAILAHWLKGAGGTAGFPELMGAGAQLEQHAHSGDAAGVATELDRIAALAARIAMPISPSAGQPVFEEAALLW